ncbi:ribosomal protein S18-alanine N-acetyltransferase [Aquabacterium sp. OR-4]|uniref:ribosomal protein S18-alanine N-acetyltransferase n=1 Tax=Aquabacterium sp. OR-4 TaxID=2978127 RepID=UPI0028C58769|nr:ribosomal protein S18-alanine N-acetyltransferase [Aquabacterium sp. OR-4]MDT7837421.1 ribosomal protein S18-alanine N-acetyltransferase [Aquabacterium sp. OR-4]
MAGPQRAQGEVQAVHRAMQVTDLDPVMAVEAGAYSHPWTRGNFIDSLAAGYDTELRLAPPGQLIGYMVAMRGVGETHLLNITVAPAWQRRGHARALLARLLAQCRARADEALWLEVRQSNAPARALYAACGFAEVGLRRGYYPAERGREDALVMRLGLPQHAATGLPPTGPWAQHGGDHALG